MTHPWALLMTAAKLVWALSTSPMQTVSQIALSLLQEPRLLVFLGSGFAAFYLMMLFADLRMDAVFAGFWYSRQPALRDGLRQARANARATLVVAYPHSRQTDRQESLLN